MNAHTQITPAADHRALEASRRLLVAATLRNRLNAYITALTASGGTITQSVEYADIELLDAIHTHTECDDVGQLLEDRCWEDGLDTDGYHVNDDGDRVRGRCRELLIGGIEA